VGRKVVMAITGLLLCGFLVVHLAGNLLLYAGSQAYNDYAHALHKNEGLLKVASLGLLILFGSHILIAFQVSAENRAARKVGYALKQSKQEGRYVMEPLRPDLWMLVSGIVVLAFLILHLIDFTWEARASSFYESQGQTLEPFDKAKALLSWSNPITVIGYVVGCFFLFAHLAHGVQSSFQTLGLNHPKYTPLIKLAGLLFAITIGVGFASFPLMWSMNAGGQSSASRQVETSARSTSDLSAVPEPPPGTLEGVDDPRPMTANSQEVLEDRAKTVSPIRSRKLETK
jgi:succinate dehydrogenase / fumarate reductase, cytochrome b subunit